MAGKLLGLCGRGARVVGGAGEPAKVTETEVSALVWSAGKAAARGSELTLHWESA